MAASGIFLTPAVCFCLGPQFEYENDALLRAREGVEDL